MLVVLLLSCVTKGAHELVEIQLDATRTSLSARNATCYNEIQNRDARLSELEQALSALQYENSTLAEHDAQQGEELTRIRAELAAEISPQTVERVQSALAVLAQQEQTTAQGAVHLTAWQERLGALESEGRLSVLAEGDDVLVRIPTAQVFNEGRVSVSPRGEVLLAVLADSMTGARRDRLLVTAHTDSTPYHSAAHASSWELGFAQAMTLVRSLQTEDDTGYIVAASAAGTMPLVAGDDAEARKTNQRLEIRIRP